MDDGIFVAKGCKCQAESRTTLVFFIFFYNIYDNTNLATSTILAFQAAYTRNEWVSSKQTLVFLGFFMKIFYP